MAVRDRLRGLVDLPLREQIEAVLDTIPKVRPGEIEDLREEIAGFKPSTTPVDWLAGDVATAKTELARLMSDIQANTAALVLVRQDVEAARAAAREARERAEAAANAVSAVQNRLSALRES